MLRIFLSLILFSFLLSLAMMSCSDQREEKLNSNKELVKQFNELINNKQFDKLNSIVKQDFKRHSQATADMQEINSLEEFIKLQEGFLSSISDQKVSIEKLITEGDYVAVYATYSGTNDGPLPPFPATNKYVELKFLSLFRIDEDKIAEMWVEWDNIAFLSQLGLFPPPELE